MGKLQDYEVLSIARYRVKNSFIQSQKHRIESQWLMVHTVLIHPRLMRSLNVSASIAVVIIPSTACMQSRGRIV
jgi:hypothetical protein